MVIIELFIVVWVGVVVGVLVEFVMWYSCRGARRAEGLDLCCVSD